MIFHYVEETFQTLKQHKARNVLTGFGVAWALFIFVLLAGLGEGVEKGFSKKFAGYVQNSMKIICWNFQNGFRGFTQEVVGNISKVVHGVKAASPEVHGWSTETIFYKGREFGNATIWGVSACYAEVSKLELSPGGRFINERDEALNRPVCVIGSAVKDILFWNEDPVGRYIDVNGTFLQVIGMLEPGVTFNEAAKDRVIVPAETGRILFGWPFFFYREILVLLKPKVNSLDVEKELKDYLSKCTKFDPNDPKTHFVANISKQVNDFNNMFLTIRLILLLVGLCLLLSGVVGISNMMLMTVRERTKEIGIRKVIGAKSREIMFMIISETIIISLISGSVGMLAGLASIFGLNKILEQVNQGGKVLIAPMEFHWPLALGALVVLVIAGGLAGVAPARRATAILPIKALNAE